MSESEQGGAGRREVAYRVFAAEYEDADYSYSESDEERAPNYVITPTGARVNRLFVVGVLTEVDAVNESMLRGRVVDPTGAFVLYAGQYQPDEQAFLEGAEPPMFVALTGKARTFEPEDGNEIYSSVRPESINEVDAETRDRWTVQTAEQTLARVGTMATALSTGLAGEELHENLREQGIDEGLAAGIPLALDHYGTTPHYLATLRETALDAARVVAGEREEVDGVSVRPDAPGEETAAELAETTDDVDLSPDDVAAVETGTAPASPATTGTDATGTGGAESETSDTDAGVETTESEASGDEPAGDDTVADAGTAGERESDPEPAGDTTGDESSEKPAASTAEPDDTGSEPADATAGGEDDGDGAAGNIDVGDGAADDDDLGDFEPGEFDLDEETREEVKEEYGTEFQSGTEVEEPGEADIETPDPEELDAAVSESAAEPTESDTPGETRDEGGDETTESADAEAVDTGGAEAVDTAETDTGDAEAGGQAPDDIEAALLDVMNELDDGDGAERGAVLLTMSERYGLDDAAVEEAIEEALMGGKCYEPDDSSLKPI